MIHLGLVLGSSDATSVLLRLDLDVARADEEARTESRDVVLGL